MTILHFIIACLMIYFAVRIGAFVLMACVWVLLALVGMLVILVGEVSSAFRKGAK